MQLVGVKLKNFRGYSRETYIKISDFTAFIGKNDAGKSTILEALEIFFNNSTVVCERDDLSIDADSRDIEISCVFSNFNDDEIVVDSTAPTSLEEEYLLNTEGNIEIKKVFSTTAAKPKPAIYIVCNHPTAEGMENLLALKRTELRSKVNSLGIDPQEYNSNINHTMRKAIWSSCDDLRIQLVKLRVDKEDSKKIYDSLEKSLPIFALFQSDRASKDDDKEVSDPMRIAVQQALSELQDDIEAIKERVRIKAVGTAQRTLQKLREMDSELASTLMPEFKTEPKFDSQFKLSIKSDNDIPVNKRGSGVRRLILLNFFRAEAERRRNENNNNQVIYAFEEPETSQHPRHQEMLIKSLLELSSNDATQVIITTHTPALASYLPLKSVRYVTTEDGIRVVKEGEGDDAVLEEVADTLGILPDPIPRNVTALLLVEGKGDVVFLNHMAEQLKLGDFIPATLLEARFALVPVGGCGNLKFWKTMKLAEQFSVPWCVLLDSDRGTPEASKNAQMITQLKADGIKAYVTRKREPENYIHSDCFEDYDTPIVFSDVDDAKVIINRETRIAKNDVLERFWVRMTTEKIREVEAYEEDGEIKYEFSDIINDFLSLVIPYDESALDLVAAGEEE
ncbi:AAA family ATPase [Bacillus mycoides]|uniref:Lantibiotic ABC transporter n=1 Tax=Bacillus thuringiensis serovar navarrensis TaxID=339658 RepID=A0A243A518_BACTU|nr:MULTISPECIES: AAA family ATPase [Bacillus cereus group]MED1268208.1 AAA family ATPase [Bacillus mycoides]OTY12400.1 lantibiotic ABC transporter [Bacillus thuringiensis serovar navarrensis]